VVHIAWFGKRFRLYSKTALQLQCKKIFKVLRSVVLSRGAMIEERGCIGSRWGNRREGGKEPLGRPRHWWVDNIRMDLQKLGCGYMDWNGLAQDRDSWRMLVNAVMNLRVPWNAGNFFTSYKPVGFSRRTLHHGVSKLLRSHKYSSLAQNFSKLTNTKRFSEILH